MNVRADGGEVREGRERLMGCCLQMVNEGVVVVVVNVLFVKLSFFLLCVRIQD